MIGSPGLQDVSLTVIRPFRNPRHTISEAIQDQSPDRDLIA